MFEINMGFVCLTYIKMLSGSVYTLLCWLHSLLVSLQLRVPLFLPHWIIFLAASLDFTFHHVQAGYPKSAHSVPFQAAEGSPSGFNGSCMRHFCDLYMEKLVYHLPYLHFQSVIHATALLDKF